MGGSYLPSHQATGCSYSRVTMSRGKLDYTDLREMGLMKYYRVIRGWASKTYGILNADLEVLMYLDSLKRFRRKDFEDGVYIYSWNNDRWARLVRDGWVDVWRHKNNTTQKYAIYKTSYKTIRMIDRIYKMMLGDEDPPITSRSVFYKNKTYTDKVYNKAIDDMIKDKTRNHDE